MTIKRLLLKMEEYFKSVAGYKVVGVAKDGIEALGLVDKLAPDFLLLDIVMPELDGFGVLSALRCGSYKPIIIMISQLATDGFVSKSIRGGAEYFMAKPVNFDKLKEYLDECSNPVINKLPPLQAMQRDSYRSGNRSLDEKIANIFISVGIPAHIKGYQFLREAIKMAIFTPDIINS
jgi:two-component system response regulator (stage 0 sporulation protein A)